MFLLFGALCHLDLRKVVWCQLEQAGEILVSERSRLCQEASGHTGQQESASTIGSLCHWCRVESGWDENIPLPIWGLLPRKGHLMSVRAS